jgi:hypothetical protein
MEVSDQLFAPAALLPGKESPVPVEYVGGQAPKPVWTFWGEDLFAAGNQTTVFPTLSP